MSEERRPKDADEQERAASQTATPRWVKVGLAICVLALVLLVITLLSGQEHGPGRHSSAAAARVVVQ